MLVVTQLLVTSLQECNEHHISRCSYLITFMILSGLSSLRMRETALRILALLAGLELTTSVLPDQLVNHYTTVVNNNNITKENVNCNDNCINNICDFIIIIKI